MNKTQRVILTAVLAVFVLIALIGGFDLIRFAPRLWKLLGVVLMLGGAYGFISGYRALWKKNTNIR